MLFPKLVVIAAAVTTSVAIARPIASDTVTLSGRVVSVIWIDKIKFESDGAALMASGEVGPGHYVILQSNSGTVEQRGQLSGLLLFGLSKWPHWSIAKAKLEDNQVMIRIPGPRISSLVKDVQIEVEHYQVKGDEWQTFTSFNQLLVSGKRIEMKEAEKATTSDNSKASD